MNQAHSTLRPSAAARRMLCSGSRAMEELFPELEESESAKEGHAAHHVAANIVMGVDVEGFKDTMPHGLSITEEMLYGAELLSDVINSTCQSLTSTPYAPILHVEEKINITSIHPQCYGTPDVWYFNPERRRLYIFDYKFGHKSVDAFENWQLIAYAAGILEKLRPEGIQDQHINVEFFIVQPRSYHKEGAVRQWPIKASELRPYFNQLEASEHAAMQHSAPCTPNPECNFCSARHACQALQQAVLTRIDSATQSIPHVLTEQQTGNLLRQIQQSIKLMEALETGLSAQALAMIKQGRRVPGFTLDQAMGRDRWTVDASEVLDMTDLLDIDIRKPIELITPKQAIKLGVSKELVNSLSETPKGAFKLVAEKENAARKIFGG